MAAELLDIPFRDGGRVLQSLIARQGCKLGQADHGQTGQRYYGHLLIAQQQTGGQGKRAQERVPFDRQAKRTASGS